MSGIHFSLQRGNPLLLLAALAVALLLALWFYRSTLPPLKRSSRRLLALLRFGSIGLLLFLLFDPLVTFETVRSVKPNVVVLVDRSASMGIRESDPRTGDPLSRAEEAEAILEKGPRSLRKKLSRRYDLSAFAFSDHVEPYTKDARMGDRTNLAMAMTESMNAEWERGVDAFIILSDGIINAGRDPVRLARELAVPVFPIAMGSALPARDLSIQQVLANKMVYVNSRVSVEIAVRGKGFAGKNVPIRILEKGEPVAAGEIAFREKRERRTVTLDFPMSREGIHRYEVEIPLQEGEQVSENNRFLLTMEAVKEKVKIVVLADRPGWDFAFFKRVLDHDANLEADCFVQRKDGRPGRVDGPSGPAFPSTAEQLAPYDLVVVFGTPAALSREWDGAIDSFVRRRGGSLIFFAPDPLTGPIPDRFAELLPVKLVRGRDGYSTAPFSAKITVRGKSHPIVRMNRDEKKNLALWEELPPLQGVNIVGAPKGGSTVLARHPTLRAEGRDLALLALAGAGKGSVFFANGSGYWNWDFRMWGAGRTNRTYEQLWSNVIRWMVARGGFRNVSVQPENLTYNRGDEVVLRGRVMDTALEPVSDARVEVTLTSADGDERRFFLQPSSGEAGSFEKSLGSLPPGRFHFTATAVRREEMLGEDSGEFTVSEFSAEFLETERNDPLLASIAAAGGGRMIDAGELDRWDGDLGLQMRSVSSRREREIWNSPFFFFALIALLSTEWLFRKRRGLS